jgi:thioredoxin 1
MTPLKSSGLETTSVGAEAVAVTGQVTEVTKDTFWPIVKAAGEKIVVVDMYTQWYPRAPSTSSSFQSFTNIMRIDLTSLHSLMTDRYSRFVGAALARS